MVSLTSPSPLTVFIFCLFIGLWNSYLTGSDCSFLCLSFALRTPTKSSQSEAAITSASPYIVYVYKFCLHKCSMTLCACVCQDGLSLSQREASRVCVCVWRRYLFLKFWDYHTEATQFFYSNQLLILMNPALDKHDHYKRLTEAASSQFYIR